MTESLTETEHVGLRDVLLALRQMEDLYPTGLPLHLLKSGHQELTIIVSEKEQVEGKVLISQLSEEISSFLQAFLEKGLQMSIWQQNYLNIALSSSRSLEELFQERKVLPGKILLFLDSPAELFSECADRESFESFSCSSSYEVFLAASIEELSSQKNRKKLFWQKVKPFVESELPKGMRES